MHTYIASGGRNGCTCFLIDSHRFSCWGYILCFIGTVPERWHTGCGRARRRRRRRRGIGLRLSDTSTMIPKLIPALIPCHSHSHRTQHTLLLSFSHACFMTSACPAGSRRHGTPAWAAWWEPPSSTTPAGHRPLHRRLSPRKPRSRGGHPKAPSTAEECIFVVVVVRSSTNSLIYT